MSGRGVLWNGRVRFVYISLGVLVNLRTLVVQLRINGTVFRPNGPLHNAQADRMTKKCFTTVLFCSALCRAKQDAVSALATPEGGPQNSSRCTVQVPRSRRLPSTELQEALTRIVADPVTTEGESTAPPG